MNNPELINIHNLSWNASADCIFTATVTNNMVTELHFCEPPAKVDEEQTCLKSTNEHFLRQLAANLTELLAYVDRERGKVGAFRVDEKEEKV